MHCVNPCTAQFSSETFERLSVGKGKSMKKKGGRRSTKYRKIPKISPGAYIFQRPFLRGLFLEGLMYGRKFAFQNQLG